MLSTLPAFLRIPLAFLVITVNTVVLTSTLFVAAFVKFVIPQRDFRRFMSARLVALAELWIAINSAAIRAFTRTRIIVEGSEGLRYQGWYLVISNHQSWVDIPILQAAFNRRMPFFKFFLKKELIWVPFLGLAWWALDYPFMRRYDRAMLEKRPELRGRDRAETRLACERFRSIPVSVMNFVEGTRFTGQKHAAQASPFRHLLKPRSGGVAFVVDSMGDMLQSLVDITLVYPAGKPTVMDLIANRIPSVEVHVRERVLPADLLNGDYDNDADYRERFQTWLQTIWLDKDALIEARLSAVSSQASANPTRSGVVEPKRGA
ncbi:MAG: acyltransferase [Pseudomarimonas sp.]